MKLSEIGELSLLERLRKRYTSTAAEVVAGIGDDAAALDIGGERLLLSTDTMAEGIHFDLNLCTPYQVAFKLITSNVSDIYSMGGIPEWSLLSLSLPPQTEEDFFDDFLDGISGGLKRYGLELIGGDITGSISHINASLTITGLAGKRLIRRSGASAGDRVYLSGPLGEAACGYELLRRIGRPLQIERGEEVSLELSRESAAHILRRFLLPEAQDLSGHLDCLTSMIDLSDGLFIDLKRLCRESCVGVKIYDEKLPMTDELKETALFLGIDTRKLISSGGEDYQQLFTSNRPLEGFIEIGEVTEEGEYILLGDGSEVEIEPEGYQHFVS